MFARLFQIKQVTALKKSKAGAVYKYEIQKHQDKTVFSDLKMHKLEEMIKKVVIANNC